MRRFVSLTVGVALAAGCIAAQDGKVSRPLVTVYGTAELKVVPDMVDISIGVEIRGKDLALVIEQQTSRVTESVSLIKKAGVDAKEIQTDFSNITPVYSDSKNGRNLDYYIVRKGIAFTLKDTSKFDSLVAALAQSGINRVQNVRFRATELSKYREQAREMAVVAAREKAMALAGKLDQRIGKAYSIEEEEPPVINLVTRAGLASNTSFETAPEGSQGSDGSFMPGQISVQARVKVEFELQ
jgi:uncharacterized protein YggE